LDSTTQGRAGGVGSVRPKPLRAFSSLDQIGPFLGPGWLPERSVRLTKAGSKKLSHDSTGAAGGNVAKATLERAVHGQATRLSAANDRAGWRRIATALKDTRRWLFVNAGQFQPLPTRTPQRTRHRVQGRGGRLLHPLPDRDISCHRMLCAKRMAS